MENGKDCDVSMANNNDLVDENIDDTNTSTEPITERPSPSRRLSSGDEDTTGPRKRPAIMASDQVELMAAEQIAAGDPTRRTPPSQSEEPEHKLGNPLPRDDEDIDMTPRSIAKIDINGVDGSVDETAPTDVSTDGTTKVHEAHEGVSLEPESPQTLKPEDDEESEYTSFEPLDENAGANSPSPSDHWRPHGSPEIGETSEIKIAEEEMDEEPLDIMLVESLQFLQIPLRGNHRVNEENFFRELMHSLAYDACPFAAIDELQKCMAMLAMQDSTEAFLELWEQAAKEYSHIPTVMFHFMQRTDPFDVVEFAKIYPPTKLDGLQMIMSLFDTLLRLTARATAVDVAVLSLDPESSFTSCARQYLEVTSHLLDSPCKLFSMLHHRFSVNLVDAQQNALAKYVINYKGLQAVTLLVDGTLPRMVRQTDLWLFLFAEYRVLSLPVCIAKTVQQTNGPRTPRGDETDEIHARLVSAVVKDFLDLYESCDKHLCQMVEAGVVILRDNLLNYMTTNANVLALAVGLKEDACETQLKLLGIFNPALPLGSSMDLIAAVYKAKIYNFMIRKCKKIEMRLAALESMNQHLVSIWNDWNHRLGDPSLVQINEAINIAELIGYLLGPHSHFQLIQKAGNIVSYTLVMQTFDQHVHDTIWRPIVEPRDPSIVNATVTMLKDLVKHLRLDNAYACLETLGTLPVTAWDTNLLQLLGLILKFCGQQCHGEIDLRPYRVLQNVMNQSLLAESQGLPYVAMQFVTLYQTVLGELRGLAYCDTNLSVKDKRTLLSECLGQLQNATDTASCSVQILYFLLQDKDMRPSSSPSDPEIRDRVLRIIEQNNILPLFEKNLAIAVQTCLTGTPEVRGLKMHPYFEMLQFFIREIPESISVEQGSKIWYHLCGDGFVDTYTRKHTFDFLRQEIFNQVTSRKGTTNSFLENCFKVYFPRLDAKYFVSTTLDFCIQSIESLRKKAEVVQAIDLESDEVIEIEGMEQIWRIILESTSTVLAVNAVKYFVTQYLDSTQVLERTLESAQATHTSIIQRCISQLTSAANSLRGGQTPKENSEGFVVVPANESPETLTRKSLEYTRSLLVLTEFLKAHKLRPRYAIKVMHETSNVQMVGDLWTLRYRLHGHGYDTKEALSLEVGNLINGNELFQVLANVSGFNNFRVISGGQEASLRERKEPIRDLIKPDQMLLIMHRPSTHETTAASMENLTSVETETLKHFEELYGLLSLPVAYSSLIWTLLAQFPPQNRIRDLLNGTDTNVEDVFPSDSPYRIFYSLYTLQHWLQEDVVGEGTYQEKAERAVQWLAIATVNTAQIDNVHLHIRMSLSSSILEWLLSAMKGLGAKDVDRICFANNVDFVMRLIAILEECTNDFSLDVDATHALIERAFHALLYASAFNGDVWTALVEHRDTKVIIESLLLKDVRKPVRDSVEKLILSTCCDPIYTRRASLSSDGFDVTMERNHVPSQLDYCTFFWPILLQGFDTAAFHPYTAKELYETANKVFEQLYTFKWPGLQPEAYALDWSTKLKRHKHSEIIGLDQIDYNLPGYAKLLASCLQHFGPTLNLIHDNDIIDIIVRRLLFPPLSDPDEEVNVLELQEAPPVLDSAVREDLYNLVKIFIDDVQVIENMVDLLTISFNEAFEESPAHNFFNDRSTWLRSTTGYVGLANQSNTCYLNSLLTQLFMNINFRKVMLGLGVSDIAESQELLRYTKDLFAHLQSSWKKAFEPRCFTASIKDYESAPIDVQIQMDVDEFYNLLFDRLEGQIESIDDKNNFRGLYGGQLVQQVKSKECEHVSEREEPFSAIQCDIKDKLSLQDSLKAYVEGEAMDGDNKYSCSGCGKHVDAVKRTCLKQVPNHLIFHLKRFDFDLRTMSRSKINDRFTFPPELDMHPYTIEALSAEDGNTTKSDIFELVGVLVHSGNAESGHYYSYIKERMPQPGEETTRWFEFNDSEVSPFDPDTIDAACFGGVEPSKDSFMQPKVWSAYMLFYERKTSLEATTELARVSGQTSNLPVPENIYRNIIRENELAVRKYAMYDLPFLGFTAFLLQKLQEFSKGKCSAEHSLETKTVRLILETLESIAIRTKSVSWDDYKIFFELLTEKCGHCIQCCEVFLQWFTEKEDSVRNFLLRNPAQESRQAMSELLLLALGNLRNQEPTMYGFDFLDGPDGNEYEDVGGFFHTIIDNALDHFEHLANSLRSWDEFFFFIAGLAKFGVPERQVMITRNWLKKCCDLLLIDFIPAAHRNLYPNLVRWMAKRRPSQDGLVEVIADLFELIDLSATPEIGDYERETSEEDNQSLAWTTVEKMYITYEHKKHGICFIQRVFEFSTNYSAGNRIVKKYINSKSDMNTVVVNTLLGGAESEPADNTGPWLEALITVAENTKLASDITRITTAVAKDIQTIGNGGGMVHYKFYESLYNVNTTIPRNLETARFRVVETMPEWAPVLLTYHDKEVREHTVDFCEDHLLANDLSAETKRVRDAKEAIVVRLFKGCYDWTNERMLVDSQTYSFTDADRFIELLQVMTRCCDEIKGDDRDVLRRNRVKSMFRSTELLCSTLQSMADENAAKALTTSIEAKLVDDDGSDNNWQESDADMESTQDGMDIGTDDFSS